jgi:hypothetical protein
MTIVWMSVPPYTDGSSQRPRIRTVSQMTTPQIAGQAARRA